MNVLFVSPHFPPNWFHFVRTLHEAGAAVLGIGDAPIEAIDPNTRLRLTDYAYVPNMTDEDAMLRATAWLIARNGRIDRIDSLNEFWLIHEARLRRAFNVPGLSPEGLVRLQHKSNMKRMFAAHGLPHAPGLLCDDADAVRAFARDHGFPLAFKPDRGVGSAGAFRVDDAASLEAALGRVDGSYICEAWIEGAVVSFDGLTNAEGDILFEAAHENSAGVLDIVTNERPMHYYTLRDIPAVQAAYGRAAVAAADLRERFFHVELFRKTDGGFVLNEINVRPPGGFTMEMMNYSADADLHALWAHVLVKGHPPDDFVYDRRYHCAYVARRKRSVYRRDDAALRATWGESILLYVDMPPPFRRAMGDGGYLVRRPELAELKALIADVEETA